MQQPAVLRGGRTFSFSSEPARQGKEDTHEAVTLP